MIIAEGRKVLCTQVIKKLRAVWCPQNKYLLVKFQFASLVEYNPTSLFYTITVNL